MNRTSEGVKNEFTPIYNGEKWAIGPSCTQCSKKKKKGGKQYKYRINDKFERQIKELLSSLLNELGPKRNNGLKNKK